MLRGRWAVGLVLLAVLLTTAPYIVATTLAKPGTHFSGFLLNPVDGFSYLAKMRQGTHSPLEFTLPYAAQPGPGALFFAFYLFLGRLSDVAGVEPIWLYHGARIAGTLAMFGSAWALFRRTLDSAAARGLAFGLALFGSGVGWLGVPFGLLPNDLWVPESIPLLSGYANAHFAFAAALLITAIALIAFDDCFPRQRLPLTFAVGLALALVQPFAALPVLLTAAIWTAGEAYWQRDLRPALNRAPALLAFAAGCGPLLVYELLAVRLQPALADWASQNLTPTPGLLETALGYGLVLVLAAAGIVLGGAMRRPGERLLAVWGVVGLALLFSPLALQRRMALGLFFPLAGLAGAALVGLIHSTRRRALAVVAVLALALPSHAIVFGAGLQSVASGDAALVIGDAERQAYREIARQVPAGQLVLAASRSGNRIPAFSEARVLYGHPFETPHAVQQESVAIELFGWGGETALALSRLNQLRVGYVLYGPEERQLGSPDWLNQLQPVWSLGEFQLYRVAQR